MNRILNGKDGYIPIGKWQFPQSEGEPDWFLAQWYSKYCLINERKDVGSPYVITDTADSKKVVYDPTNNSLSMNLNAAKIYGGENRTERGFGHTF